jgi:hypothetical protein
MLARIIMILLLLAISSALGYLERQRTIKGELILDNIFAAAGKTENEGDRGAYPRI